MEKCGVMHMRRRGVKRTGEKFYVDSKEIEVVEEYKYLGCVINEQLGSRRMVEERAKAGARVLSEWLRKCRVVVGEVRGEMFVKLMEVLVGLVLMYILTMQETSFLIKDKCSTLNHEDICLH